MASGIAVKSKTATSITFTLTLSNAFNANNYNQVGVCNFTFDNDIPSSYFIINPTFNRLAWATTAFNNSTSVDITVNGLESGKTYTFYGFAQANNSRYYCIPYPQEALVVTTKNTSSGSGIPEDLICRKRYQSEDESVCRLDFEVTLPQKSSYVKFQISTDKNFESIKQELILYTEDDVRLENVTGDTYAFTVTGLTCATIFYVRARCKITGESREGSWCSTIRITTPPSNRIFTEGGPRISYGSSVKRLNLFIEDDVLSYAFTQAVFTIYKDGVPVNITHTRKGSTFTAYNGGASYTEYKDGFATSGRTGIAIYYPEAGTYLGVIRVYFLVDGYALQPVDEDGNEICFMDTITIEPSKERPDYFYWDNNKTSGGEYNLTANEWNRLTNNINQMFAYKNLETRNFTTVVSQKTTVTSDIVNEVLNALNDLASSGFVRVESGQPIPATLFDDIKNDLNNIE